MTDVRLMTQDEVAQLLRRSVKTVARLRAAGELAWLPGSPVLIPETEVRAYLDRKTIKRRTVERSSSSPVAEPGVALIAKLKRQGRWQEIVDFHRKTRDAKR